MKRERLKCIILPNEGDEVKTDVHFLKLSPEIRSVEYWSRAPFCGHTDAASASGYTAGGSQAKMGSKFQLAYFQLNQ